MNSTELALAIQKELGLNSKSSSAEIVNVVFDRIADALQRGEEVRINGFGKFAIKSTPERQGRNPRTNEMITIAQRNRVNFSASETLKTKVNQ